MTIQVDVVAARAQLRLNAIEVAALLGIQPSAVSRLSRVPNHQGNTNALYLLLVKAPKVNLVILLRYWLTHKPEEWQVPRLLRVAARCHPQYPKWREAFRSLHPYYRELIDTTARHRRRAPRPTNTTHVVRGQSSSCH